MSKKVLLIIKYYLLYLVFLIIFKNIHYLIFISFEMLQEYRIIFLPIAYLVVKILVYNDLRNQIFLKKDVLWHLVVGFTMLNVFYGMPYIYTLSIILFLFILKDEKTFKNKLILDNIKRYFDRNIK